MTQSRCPAKMELADDEGDNSTTFHCQRQVGHVGPHQEWNHKEAGIAGEDWFIMVWQGFEPYSSDEENESEESD